MKRKVKNNYTHASLFERLVKLETLMENHLAHHESWIKYFLFPILVGVILTFLAVVVNILWL